MGQQVPFETLNSVAAALWSRQSDEPLTASDARVRYVAFGEEWLPRVELTLDVNGDARNEDARSGAGRNADARNAEAPDGASRKHDARNQHDAHPGGSGKRDVHLYEVYWAPLTEGKVTLRDVLLFLVTAGLRGIRCCAHGSFDRWIFDARRSFRLPRRGVLQLGALLVLLGALALIFAALALAGAAELSRLFHPGALPAAPGWLRWLSTKTILGLLAGGAILFAALRWFLVQSVGDVVAYISAHHASRFTEIRRGILAEARKVARNVYASRLAGHGDLEYGHVIIVGHSLGSVIAYDMLNDSINRDLLAGESGGETLDVVRRTKLLLTMGSPLDKTAFIFRTQKDDAPLREALAAAAQPMVVSYANRPERWINIWSRFDWVSGSLEYYDVPLASDGASGSDISNVDASGARPAANTSSVDVSSADPSAGDRSAATRRQGEVENIGERGVPFDTVRAHLGYWRRPEFGKRVFAAIAACGAGGAGRSRGVSAA
jgi:hypothetical protein